MDKPENVPSAEHAHALQIPASSDTSSITWPGFAFGSFGAFAGGISCRSHGTTIFYQQINAGVELHGAVSKSQHGKLTN